jgi:hypothetical protein
LHDLRRLYNSAKHDPSWTPSILDLQGLFSRLGNVIGALAANNVGLLNKEIQNRFHQIFWLAVWDHFIGGDSEVHVIDPYRGGRPPTLDMVYVDLVRWDDVKAALASVGSVRTLEPISTEVQNERRQQPGGAAVAVIVGMNRRKLIVRKRGFQRYGQFVVGIDPPN